MLETISHPEISDGDRLETDVLVIGSGAGGAVTAKILAEAGRDVLVVEEGGYFTEATYGDSPGKRIAHMWRLGYETQTQGSVQIHIPTGRVVGGSTVINSGSCFRPPHRVLEKWVDWGLDSVAPEVLARELDEIEAILSVKPVPDELLGTNGELVREGSRSLGFSGGNIPRNIDGCEGSGICVLGCPTGGKQAMHVSYLPRAQMNGAKIVERVRIDDLLISDGRAKGATGTLVDSRQTSIGSIEFSANEVILAAGPIHTPNLLAKARIGNPDHVGRHLQIHPCAGVMGIFPNQVEGSPNTLQSYYIDQFVESHRVLLEATALVPGMNPGMETTNSAFVGVFAFDSGEGDIVERPDGTPQPRYEIHPDDVTSLAFGVMQCARIFLAAGARAVKTGHPDMKSVTTFAEADRLASLRWEPGYFRPTAFHPVGTARMGADEESSVVDSGGRVWGYPNLRIADASILPSCPEVNPQETVMALAATVARSAAL